jgi:hypothetical protein
VVNRDGSVSGESGGDAEVIDYGNEDDISSNLAMIYLDPANSYNYTLDYDPFIPGEARATRWRLKVDNPDEDAIAYVVFRDRANNDTVIVITYEAEVLSVPDELATVIVTPNPASDHIRLHAPAGARVELVDLLGRSVRQMQLQSDQVMMTVGDLPVGSYRVIVHGTGRVVSLPLQVLR